MNAVFRGTGNTKMDFDNFGIGSTLHFEKTYLIIATSEHTINILDLKEFKICGHETTVEDIYFLSHGELDLCCSPLQLARSDFDYNAKGLKDNKIE